MAQQFKIDEDFITLGQFLKYTGIISTGGQAKWFLSEHIVTVNNEPETRRGRKLFASDHIFIDELGEFEITH